ncbi:MAG: M48 family metallopeptidase [Bacteroidales bacterium]|jgi:predicted metal-dependent hydrolase|nr:M48 family metallopeptidase [Bacteroidales bacterium]MCI2122188.1 M48 family metallopeptidase [Bacteroidales bacterium]MCI2145592.1 M48 family metallopeptidase [Bacteroidales bacterium]
MDKFINDPDIGRIHLRKVPGISELRISVHPRLGVTVSVPWLLRYPVAIRFLREKKPWIMKMQEKQRRREAEAESSGKGIPLIGDGTVLHTLNRTVTVRQSEDNLLFKGAIDVEGNSHVVSTRRRTLAQKRPMVRVKMTPDSALITFPADFPSMPEKDSVEGRLLSSAYQRILRREAKEVLPQKMAGLAAKHGFKYNRLAFKNNISNWGSCSSRDNINLNIHLMRLPERLVDYVCLHELCHLKHHDHGAGFHKLLDSLCGGHEAEYRAELRSYRLY